MLLGPSFRSLAIVLAGLTSLTLLDVAPVVGQSLRDAFKSDLQYLAKELPQRHKNLFFKLSEADFQRQVKAIEGRIDELDSRTFQLELSRLIASAGDGHTRLAMDLSKMHYYPFNARWFDDQVAIVAADAGDDSVLGASLKAINGMPIAKVLEKLRPYYSIDNEYSFRNSIDSSLNHAEMLAYACGFEDLTKAEFTFNKNGREFKRQLEAVPQTKARQLSWKFASTKFPLYAQKSRLNFWNDWLADSGTLYFKYNRCQDSAGFLKLVNGTIAFADQNDVQRFVVDLRNNGGGNSAIFKPLAFYLSSQQKYRQPGRLFVIVGRGTFSSGLFAAYDLKRLGAVVVGEPTGGKPNHYGEIKPLKLPATGLVVYYSTRYWTFLEGEDPDSLEPDVRVEFTAEAALNGKDPALEAILEYEPPGK